MAQAVLPTEVKAKERWVDAHAPLPGDGSPERPFRSLAQALEVSPPLVVHLRSGLYPGPLELPGGVRLQGHGRVVLHADGEHVVRAAGAVGLESLHLQGGQRGLVARGVVQLRQTSFSGQRVAAIGLEEGRLEVVDSTLEATVSQASGVVVGERAELSMVGCLLLGPFVRGVESRQGGAVRVSATRFEGAVTGVGQVGGRLRVSDASFAQGRGPAVFAARAQVELSGLRVLGHEYAVQLGHQARAVVKDLVSVRADNAAVAAVGATLTLEDSVLVEPGTWGGLQLLESDSTVRRTWVRSPKSLGVLARKGRVALEEVVVTDVQDVAEPGSEQVLGDAVHLRDALATLQGVIVRKAQGVGVVATAGAKVWLRDVELQGCRLAGLLAEQEAQVRGSSVRVTLSPGAGLVVPSSASVRLDAFEARGCARAVWAECAAGAQVELTRDRVDAPVDGACVSRRPGLKVGASRGPDSCYGGRSRRLLTPGGGGPTGGWD